VVFEAVAEQWEHWIGAGMVVVVVVGSGLKDVVEVM